MDDERLQAEAEIVTGYQAEVERLRAACRRGEDMFKQYAAVVRQIGFPVVADDFEAYAAEFRAAIDGTSAEPVNTRLLAAAKEALDGLDRISMAIEADLGRGTYCDNIQFVVTPLRAVITESKRASLK